MAQCVRCLISGRVQGVFFRASTRHKARELGLSGRALNTDDGRVEVIACGSKEKLAELERWLWQGPPAARVNEVVCTAVDASDMMEFEIG